jgi:AcrR family transcriptional regulator
VLIYHKKFTIDERRDAVKKREDRRIMMTKRMLKDALTKMLKEKDIYHISVRELCERADVNRTTFYKYYGSQFDLLTDMENDLLDFINRAIRHYEADHEKIILAACRYVEDNLDFIRVIVNNNESALPRKLFAMDSIRENILKRVTRFRNEDEIEYFYHFLTYGAYHTICVWVNKEDEDRGSSVVLAKLILELIQDLISK